MLVAICQRGVEGSFATSGFGALLSWLGPSLLGLLLVVAVVKAMLRRHRYRAAAMLTAEDRQAVHAALRDVERRTVGEIVPVVCERSDAHPVARWRAVVAAMLAGSALLAPWLPWHAPHWLLLAQVGFGVVAALLLLAFVDLKRSFVSEARATELSEEQALQAFYQLDLPATAQRTGVLIFVSLFERRVIVLADRGIDAKVDQATAWLATKDAVLAGIARGSLRDGLIAGIGMVGSVLAQHFPWTEGDRNELPDRLIVLEG